MSRSSRRRRGAIALGLTTWSQACVAHRATNANEAFRVSSDVRIRSAAPLQLTRQTDTLPPIAVCCVTTVEGRLVRVAGDTLIVERGSGVALNSQLNRVKGSHEVLTVVRNSATEVAVREVDRTRTTLLVVGITAVLIGLAALAASQIEYSFPNGGGTSFSINPLGIWP
ncbi:MAG TPA: hypothetical protein VF105_01865 [Gemmatimonadaceae bacterium]